MSRIAGFVSFLESVPKAHVVVATSGSLVASAAGKSDKRAACRYETAASGTDSNIYIEIEDESRNIVKAVLCPR